MRLVAILIILTSLSNAHSAELCDIGGFIRKVKTSLAGTFAAPVAAVPAETNGITHGSYAVKRSDGSIINGDFFGEVQDGLPVVAYTDETGNWTKKVSWESLRSNQRLPDDLVDSFGHLKIGADVKFRLNGAGRNGKFVRAYSTSDGLMAEVKVIENGREVTRHVRVRELSISTEGDRALAEIADTAVDTADTAIIQRPRISSLDDTQEIDRTAVDIAARERWGTNRYRGFTGGTQGSVSARNSKGHFYATTDLGTNSKYKVNEDSMFAATTSDNTTILAMADGMGGGASEKLADGSIRLRGMGAGPTASSTAMSTLKTNLIKGDSVETAIAKVPDSLSDTLRRGNGKAGMGTTLQVAEIKGDKVRFYGIGDSKGGVIRGNKMLHQTVDDSPMQELVDKGIITEAERIDPMLLTKRPDLKQKSAAVREHLEQYPGATSMNNVVSGAYVTEQVGQTVITDVGKIIPSEFALRTNDVVIVASDGLWDIVTPSEVAKVVNSAPTIEEAQRQLRRTLTERILKTGKPGDNVTIMLYKHGN